MVVGAVMKSGSHGALIPILINSAMVMVCNKVK